MDFFGFSDAPELSTPVGTLVKSGTDPLLLGPDWTKNIEICDHINSHNNGADAVKAILHQLKNSDPKVVALALTMIETCVKNCVSVPQNINRSFMDEMVNISNGRKGFDNQEESLRLIQQWGLTYERRRSELPLFFDTFTALKTRGVRFPAVEEAAQPPARSSQSGRGAPLSSSIDQASSDQADDSNKLRNDLKEVLEKVRLCREMLPESPGIRQDEILAEVIGFLEACQERMIDLIEAGTQGLLSEDIFELCLRVNDAVLRTLEAEKNGTPIPVDDETTVPVSDSASDMKPPASSGAPKTMKAVQVEEDEGDLFSQLSMKPAKVVGAHSNKKVPTLKGPSENKSAGVLLPPPPPSQQQQAAVAAPAPSGGGDILDFMSDSPPKQSQQAPPQTMTATPASADDDFDSLFGSSSAAPSQTSAGAPSASAPGVGTASSKAMTDDEFESFLNTVGPENK